MKHDGDGPRRRTECGGKVRYRPILNMVGSQQLSLAALDVSQHDFGAMATFALMLNLRDVSEWASSV